MPVGSRHCLLPLPITLDWPTRIAAALGLNSAAIVYPANCSRYKLRPSPTRAFRLLGYPVASPFTKGGYRPPQPLDSRESGNDEGRAENDG